MVTPQNFDDALRTMSDSLQRISAILGMKIALIFNHYCIQNKKFIYLLIFRMLYYFENSYYIYFTATTFYDREKLTYYIHTIIRKTTVVMGVFNFSMVNKRAL